MTTTRDRGLPNDELRRPVTGYTPFDPAVIADPYPWYRWLRERHPIYRVEGADIWVVSRHRDVTAVLARRDVFSSADGIGYHVEPQPMMIALDRPEHTRQRRALSRAFTPSAVAQLAPRVRAHVDALLDRMLADCETDWWHALASPLPVTVISELLGLPVDLLHQIRAWSEDTMAMVGAVGSDDDERARRADSVRELNRYLRRVRRQRVARPGDDLVSVMLADRAPLSPKAVAALSRLLLVAGAETTTHLLTNGMHELLRAPEQWDRVVADPSLIPSMVEEMIRYQSPIQGFFRTATHSWSRHGVTIPAGARVLVLYGSANRDETVFEHPDELRVDRDPNPHVGFGSGIHLCLGAPLARLQAQTVWTRVLERGIRFERPVGTDLVRGVNPVLRSTRSLPVRLRDS